MPKLTVINKTKPPPKALWFTQPNTVQTTFIGRFSTFCRIVQGFRKDLIIKYIFSWTKMYIYMFLKTTLILDNSLMDHRTWSKLHLPSFRASVWRSQRTQPGKKLWHPNCVWSILLTVRLQYGTPQGHDRPEGAKQQLSGFSCAKLTFDLQRYRLGELQTKPNIHLRLAECHFLWLNVVEFDCILVSIMKYSNKPFYTFPSKVVSPVLVGRQTELVWWDRVGSEWD